MTALPAQRIHTDEDVAHWRSSPGYQDFVGWIVHKAERIRGKNMVVGQSARVGCSEHVILLLELLDTLETFVVEAPPQPDSQRFGNKAFRTYHALVSSRLPGLLPTPPELNSALLPLLLDAHAFGHPSRLDYGSGHELSFVLALFVLVKKGWIVGEEDEDDLILRVFPRYLELTTHLQKLYKLEPAGSHGVWGLDDYVFLPYLFGSAQLLGTDTTPEQALANAKNLDFEAQDMWTLSLKRVFEFKSGPFHEHSPLLYSLSTTFPSFVKPHRGLVKMYQEEVLGKRVVVQHLFLDDTTWGRQWIPGTPAQPDSTKPAMLEEKTQAAWAAQSAPILGVASETGAPWAAGALPAYTTSRPAEGTRAPWAR